MKVIGPFMGHGWFKLWFVGWGVGACPHEVGNVLTGGRLAALQGQALLALALAAASLLACIARRYPRYRQITGSRQ